MRTRFWMSENGSSTCVQFRTDTSPMVHLHTNIGWLPIGNAPANILDAEQFAAEMAQGYDLTERADLAEYMLGDDDDD